VGGAAASLDPDELMPRRKDNPLKSFEKRNKVTLVGFGQMDFETMIIEADQLLQGSGTAVVEIG
jgi:hypothetical protein